MVDDVVAEAGRRIAALSPENADDVRAAATPVVAFSEPMNGELDELRFYLFSWVYRNKRVSRIMSDAQRIVTDLFGRYMSDEDALPRDWLKRAERLDEKGRARQVCDFIAGMTDRFAVNEHRALFDDTPELR
jgi:dGTPase